jgi:hypothetical protein
VFEFLSTENFAGVDLVGNFSFVWLMNELIGKFRITGWTDLWFGGMPAFRFYPPLFFIVTVIISKISLGLISLKTSYKLIIFSSLIFLPLAAYFSSMRMGFKEEESFFIGLWVVAFLFIDKIFGGINQTLNYGLVAQMFSLNILVIFIGELFHSFKFENLFSAFLPGILLSLIILSHVYVTFFALLSLGIFSLINFSKMSIKFGFIVLFVGLALSSFWWMPTLFVLHLARPYGWGPMPILYYPIILVFFSLFVFFDFKIDEKNKLFLIILFLALFFIGTFGLPIPRIQYDRFFFASLVFGSFLAGIGAYNLYRFISRKTSRKNRSYFFLIMVLIPLFISLSVPLEKEWESDLKISNLLNWIRENVNDGIILVESFSGKERYVLTEIIPIETGKPTLAELHIDSSVNSPYVSLLTYEMFGSSFNFYCEYCTNATVHPNPELILKKLEKFNVKYVIVYSEKNRDYLNSFLILKDKVDNFYIFVIPDIQRSD